MHRAGWVHSAMGVAYGRLEDLEKEIACYNEAIRLDPRFA